MSMTARSQIETANASSTAGHVPNAAATSPSEAWQQVRQSAPDQVVRSEPGGTGAGAPRIGPEPSRGGPQAGIGDWLRDHAIDIRLIYTNDVLRNLSGGLKRGTIDQGLIEGKFTLDLDKLAGWNGLALYANVFQIHNTGRMLRDHVGGINSIAAIEAMPTSRLSELWLDQQFLDGAASFRFGQLAADAEFFFSGLSTMFLQSDWPTIAAADLPSGGPAYPLSTPGARLKVDPAQDASLLLAVFNGDPAGPGSGDSQDRNRRGWNLRLRDAPFIIGEAQFRYNQRQDDDGLAGTLKLGAWIHLGEFDDRRYANDGSLLADAAGSGIPAKHRGDYGIYGVIDQQVYRLPGRAPDSGVFAFSRASVSPFDRNPVDAYLDGGIVFAGLIPNRPQDRFGMSLIYASFSNRLRGFERDRIALAGAPEPVRDYQLNLELTYVARIARGWSIQPNLQFVRHPDGKSGSDARVVGVRSVWSF